MQARIKKHEAELRLAYGFVANPEKTAQHNAALVVGDMPCWFYFNRASNMACHNLCTYKRPPPNFCQLLGLGLNFCLIPKFTTWQNDKYLARFGVTSLRNSSLLT